jgi:bifunctional non-homologous end joining protein LigD
MERFSDLLLVLGTGFLKKCAQIENMPRGLPVQKVGDPSFVEPMAARLVSQFPESDDWIYEVKWDGYRVEAIKSGNRVRLMSRKGKDLSDEFPQVIEAVQALKATTAIIDGEVIAVDEEGKSSFQALQKRGAANPVQIVYYAFDILHLKGKDLTQEPLTERKSKLQRLVANTNVLFSATLAGDLGLIIEQADKLGLEGIVAKRAKSIYEPCCLINGV